MARFSSASPSCGFAACLALLGGWASICRAEVLEVRSGDAVLGLDGATGAPVRLADAGAQLELAGRDQELFRLVVVPPGGDPRQPLELSSRDAKAVSRIEGEGLRLRFEGIGNPNLAAVCVVKAGPEGRFRFGIQVEGEPGTFVERVDYPLLPLAAPLQGDGTGDALVFGTTKGGVLERPHLWNPGRSATGTQPGGLAAQFGCYYGAKGGVVTYCEDDAGHPKTLLAVRTAHGLVLGWRHLMRHDLQRARCPVVPRSGRRVSRCGRNRDRLARRGGHLQSVGLAAAVVRQATGRTRRSARLAEAGSGAGAVWPRVAGPAGADRGVARQVLDQALRGRAVDRDLLGLGRRRDVGAAPVLSAVSFGGRAETLRRRGEACGRPRLLLAVGIPVVPELRQTRRRFVRMGGSGEVRARSRTARDGRQGRQGHAHQSALVSRRRGGDALPWRPVVAGLAHRHRRGTGPTRRGTVSNRSGGRRGNARRRRLPRHWRTVIRRASASGTSRPPTAR